MSTFESFIEDTNNATTAEEVFSLFQKALQQLEHPKQITKVRKEIAQIKTVIREFDLGIRGKGL